MIARFELSRRFLRPVIHIQCGGGTFLALIDTGAVVPVCTLEADEIAALGARPLRKGINISGIGGVSKGSLYRIDIPFSIFSYIDLSVIRIDEPNMPFDFIFSATMFTGFRYAIDTQAHVLTLDTCSNETELHLRIADHNGDFRVLISGQDETAAR
ncbi:MAG: hypothetical protein IJU98_06280 [Synergistaceae bacterium]|nr:hypothetical protein [Synergistaceae bacterium]